MRFRKDIGRCTEARHPANEMLIESGDLGLRDCRPAARRVFDCLRTDAAPSAVCSVRVAAVLQKLGYGFAMIPHGKSAPQGN